MYERRSLSLAPGREDTSQVAAEFPAEVVRRGRGHRCGLPRERRRCRGIWRRSRRLPRDESVWESSLEKIPIMATGRTSLHDGTIWVRTWPSEVRGQLL